MGAIWLRGLVGRGIGFRFGLFATSREEVCYSGEEESQLVRVSLHDQFRVWLFGPTGFRCILGLSRLSKFGPFFSGGGGLLVTLFRSIAWLLEVQLYPGFYVESNKFPDKATRKQYLCYIFSTLCSMQCVQETFI